MNGISQWFSCFIRYSSIWLKWQHCRNESGKKELRTNFTMSPPKILKQINLSPAWPEKHRSISILSLCPHLNLCIWSCNYHTASSIQSSHAVWKSPLCGWMRCASKGLWYFIAINSRSQGVLCASCPHTSHSSGFCPCFLVVFAIVGGWSVEQCVSLGRDCRVLVMGRGVLPGKEDPVHLFISAACFFRVRCQVLRCMLS